MSVPEARTSDLKLFHAFINLLNDGESLDKISTRYLLTQAGVSKSTFYRHYADKFAFYDWVADYLLNQLQDTDYSAATPLSFYKRYFEKCQTYRLAYKSFIVNNHWLEFERRLLDDGMANYTAILSRINQPDVPVTTIASYVVSAHVGMAINWLQTDDPSTPDELAEQLTRLTTGALAAYHIDFAGLFKLK
ncbi:TetR-like C-terminal domain-containing protein [Secundilactobacillus hailunensis]|uniref:TetR-like C-terminal domain-containing protein n=1 Tax=Secundilactobacillus hailunensis TaxID=2559923 RepID=A0ABW1T6H7_9LACO|nr:TetR-like C-terminal domain-containing protein [Secundilactobacillus hailunensis]